jgi:hypothetical protein
MAAVLAAELGRPVVADAATDAGDVAAVRGEQEPGFLEPDLFPEWIGFIAVWAREYPRGRVQP